MFRGRYEHSIDAKGRLSIPSRFRETLAASNDARVVLTPYDGCLNLYPFEHWRRLEENVAALSEFNKDARALLRYFYSNAVDCTIDKLGRILVPQSLRDYAKLEADVVLVGAMKFIEIWPKAKWEEAASKVSEEEIVNTLSRLGL